MDHLPLYRMLIACTVALAGLCHAATYSISNEASCEALPGATWGSGSTCTLGASFTLNAGDTMTIVSPAAVVVPPGITLANNGGLLSVPGRLLVRGGRIQHTAGDIDNDGFWDIRDGGTVVVSAGAIVNNGNQIQFVGGVFENHGTLTQDTVSARLSIGGPATLRNFGALVNGPGARILLEARLENSGSIANSGLFEIRCTGVLVNSGTFTGNPVQAAHCWIGGAGLWSQAANWTSGVVPPTDGEIIIRGGPVTLDFDLELTGLLDIDIGHLVVAPGVTLTNRGSALISGGNFPGVTTIRNQGVFLNHGTLLNGNQFVNEGTFANFATVGPLGVVGVFVNSGTWGNQPSGVVSQQGIDNAATGIMVNYGSVRLTRSENFNSGRLVNFAGATWILDNKLRNRAGGSLVNSGQLNVTHDLTQPAGIDNEAGARVHIEAGGALSITAADAYVNNAGLVRNDGAVANGGIFNNTGAICGMGSFTGNPIAGNPAVAACLPAANAGADQSVAEGTVVTLNGGASQTPKGTPLAYAWTQTAGPTVPMTGANTSSPTFVAPYVAATTVLSFRLTVNDGYDAASDFVDVLVTSTNSPPAADAGDDRTGKPGTVVSLDGSHTFDPDGNPIVSWEWTQVAGPTVALVPGADAANPSFTVPNAVGATLVFKLRASDGKEWSIPSPGADAALADTVAVTIVANSRPVAVVGPALSVGENALVLLDGGASFDPDAGDLLIHRWQQTAGPPVVLNNADSATASFVAPFVPQGSNTTLAFELVVRDNDPFDPLGSAPASIDVGVYNLNDPPRCDLAAPSTASLSPPDGRMSTVGITGVLDDAASGLPFTIRITGVRQDEPVSGLTRADPSPDAIIVPGGAGPDSVQLRRERSPRGNGRVYAIAFTAHDGWEGCSGVLKVEVPARRNDAAVDDGPVYDSTGH